MILLKAEFETPSHAAGRLTENKFGNYRKCYDGKSNNRKIH